MPVARIVQTSFAGGILGQAAAEREDTSAYNNSAADIMNMVVRPQGGLSLRAGTRYCGPHRGQLTRIDLTDATLTLADDATGGDGGTGPAPPPPDPPVYPDPRNPDWPRPPYDQIADNP
jgi:hypothetical protein